MALRIDRALLLRCHVVASLLAFTAAPAAAEPKGRPAPTPPRRLECAETTEKQHAAGALYEYSQAVGLRYHHTHFLAAGCGEGFFMWGGYGLDLRMLTDFEQVDAGLAQLSGRFGTFPGAGVGFSVELGAGAGPTRDGARGLGFVGLFASFYYVDLGAAYFFPLGPFDRPSWLKDVIFAARIHVPVSTYDVHERRYSPGGSSSYGRSIATSR